MQSVISAIISGNKWVAAKSIRHIPLQPVNSDVILLSLILPFLYIGATVVLFFVASLSPLPNVKPSGQTILSGALAHSMH